MEAPEETGACGDLDWPCCDEHGPEGGKCPKANKPLTCKNNVCVEKKPDACGDLDWPCCDKHGPEGGRCPKGDNLACMDGYCRIAKCGDVGWACCRADGPEGARQRSAGSCIYTVIYRRCSA